MNAGILAVGYVAFLLVARNYKSKPHPHALGGAAAGKVRGSALKLPGGRLEAALKLPRRGGGGGGGPEHE